MYVKTVSQDQLDFLEFPADVLAGVWRQHGSKVHWTFGAYLLLPNVGGLTNLMDVMEYVFDVEAEAEMTRSTCR